MPKAKRENEIRRPVVWVVGASRGIGREIAKEFAALGFVVCATARSKTGLASLVSEVESTGGRILSVPCDITQSTELIRAHRLIAARHGGVDILVNNAGITVFRLFSDTTMKDVRSILETNLVAPAACAKLVLPFMTKQRSGMIINILSNAATTTFEGSAAYTASKAGLLGMMKVLREELRETGVKVVNVLPGATETEMWSEKARKKFAHRMMSARSVAEVVVSMYTQPDDVVVDEIVIRPQLGNID